MRKESCQGKKNPEIRGKLGLAIQSLRVVQMGHTAPTHPLFIFLSFLETCTTTNNNTKKHNETYIFKKKKISRVEA